MSLIPVVTTDVDKMADVQIKAFRSLSRSIGSEACLCLLIDPMLHDPGPDLNATREAIPSQRLSIRHDDLAKEEAPYLLVLGGEEDQERLVSRSIHLALTEWYASLNDAPCARSVCAWLFIQKSDLFKLTDALARLAVVTKPGSPSKPSLFRFWDPRVFRHLPRVLGQQVFQTMLGGGVATHWVWLAPDGQLSEQPFVSGTGWRPSSLQWEALSRIEDLNQCLVLSDAHDTTDAHVGKLDVALQRAAELSCHDSADRITYALLSQSLGGFFEQHPLMTNLFKQVKQDGASLAALAEAVEQSIWDRVRSDMAQARQNP